MFRTYNAWFDHLDTAKAMHHNKYTLEKTEALIYYWQKNTQIPTLINHYGCKTVDLMNAS